MLPVNRFLFLKLDTVHSAQLFMFIAAHIPLPQCLQYPSVQRLIKSSMTS